MLVNYLKIGAKNVLIKGGHLKSDFVKDVYLNKNEKLIFLKTTKFNTKKYSWYRLHTIKCHSNILFMWKNIKEIL